MARVQRHTWAQEAVSLLVMSRSYGVSRESRTKINFAALQVARGGLLEEALRDAPAPLHIAYSRALSSALGELCKAPAIRRILSTSARALSVRDIHTLFSACEDFVAKTNYGNKAEQSLHTRRILMYCRTRLASGETLDSCGFASRFSWAIRGGSVNLLSETYDESFDDEFLRRPLTALPLGTNQEATDALATQHLTARLQRIMDACEQIMNDHENFLQEITDIRSKGALTGLTPALIEYLQQSDLRTLRWHMEKAPPEIRLKIGLYLSKKFEYHKVFSQHRLYLHGIPALEKISGLNTARYQFGALLSEFYLPRPVLIACFIALLAETGWNLDTLLSLTAENVKIENGVYTLVGLKSKSDQLEEAAISAITDESSGTHVGQPVEHPLAIRALSLLLTYRNNIDEYALSTSDSLFVAHKLKYTRGAKHTFMIGRWQHNALLFCSHTGIPKFAFTDIRDQAAHIKYLSHHRDLFVTQAFLNHANPEVTTHYLNSTIIRCLGEANILHFVRLLAASAIFACGKSKKLTAEETKMVEKNYLLFPVSTLEDGEAKCIADLWFSEAGDFRFVVTKIEIEHTALQYLFYKESIRPLIEANHLRFIYTHLPRILFCISLYRLISNSSHKRLLDAAIIRFSEKA
jgi:integrase